MARRKHRVYYWHHAPHGWWWVRGGIMVRAEDAHGQQSSSTRSVSTLKRAMRSLRRWGGLVVRMVPASEGGVYTPREWGDWSFYSKATEDKTRG